MRKKYNTPHRSRVVKTRLSEDEYANFTARLAPYGISQSEFLRQAIRRTTIRPVIHVSAVNDELLSAVGKLAAEYGRIGGNLNQIARYLNEYGAPYTLPGHFSRDKGRPRRHENCNAALPKLHSPFVYEENPRRKRQYLLRRRRGLAGTAASKAHAGCPIL